MANYCSNTIYFCCPMRIKLDHLLSKIRECYDNPQYNSVYALYLKHGYEPDEITNVDRRDYFSCCDGVVSDYGSYFAFEIQTESAWEPNIDAFQKLIDDLYGDDVVIVYMSEEPGFDIYLTNDSEGMFFTDKYRLDFNVGDDYGTEYFESKAELVDYLNNRFETKFMVINSLEAMERTIKEKLEEQDEDANCSINYFKLENLKKKVA